jgi:hypothetical protein
MIRQGNISGSVLMSLQSFNIAIIVITLRTVPRYHPAVHPLRFPHYEEHNDCLQSEMEIVERHSDAALSFTISWGGMRNIKCSDEL